MEEEELSLSEQLVAKQGELLSLQETFDDFLASSKELEEELEAELSKAQAQISSLNTKNSELSDRLEDVLIRERNLAQELTSSQEEVARLLSAASTEAAVRTQLELSNDFLEEKVRQAEATVDVLKHATELAKEHKIFVEGDLEELKGRFRLLEAEYQHVVTELDETRQEVTRIQEKTEGDRETTVQNGVEQTKEALLVKELREKVHLLSQELVSEKQAARIQTANGVSPATGASSDMLEIRRLYESERSANWRLRAKLQELRGNIEVICRIRPVTAAEQGMSPPPAIVVEPLSDNEVGLFDKRAHEWRGVPLDKVLGPSQHQEDVFAEVEPLVSAVIEGYNSCIVCYGQTGAGKTYSMTGREDGGEDEWGIVQRSLRKLFELLNLQQQNMKADEGMTVKVAMLEVYNNEYVDLSAEGSGPLAKSPNRTKSAESLSSSPPMSAGKGSRQSAGSPIKLEARRGANGLIEIPGLTWTTVNDAASAIDVVTKGSRLRSTGATLVHDHSSRSHTCILVDYIAGTSSVDSPNGEERREAAGCSRLYLVDLAGSERVKISGVAGEAMKEAQHINSSLSALGDVMHALDTKAKHIPYRNSKLTFLLQDALGSAGRTAMICTVCPTEINYEETNFALSFAQRVHCIATGPVTKAVETRNFKGKISELAASLKESQRKAEILTGELRAEQERVRVLQNANAGSCEAIERKLPVTSSSKSSTPLPASTNGRSGITPPSGIGLRKTPPQTHARQQGATSSSGANVVGVPRSAMTNTNGVAVLGGKRSPSMGGGRAENSVQKISPGGQRIQRKSPSAARSDDGVNNELAAIGTPAHGSINTSTIKSDNGSDVYSPPLPPPPSSTPVPQERSADSPTNATNVSNNVPGALGSNVLEEDKKTARVRSPSLPSVVSPSFESSNVTPPTNTYTLKRRSSLIMPTGFASAFSNLGHNNSQNQTSGTTTTPAKPSVSGAVVLGTALVNSGVVADEALQHAAGKSTSSASKLWKTLRSKVHTQSNTQSHIHASANIRTNAAGSSNARSVKDVSEVVLGNTEVKLASEALKRQADKQERLRRLRAESEKLQKR